MTKEALPTAPNGRLHQRLPEGPLAIIGDVHGHHEALDALLRRLGLDPDDPSHNPGETLIFVGDLVDRGPNSVAVVQRVAQWVAAGRARMVLGNHEINLLKNERKSGNKGWFHGLAGRDPIDGKGHNPDYPSYVATPGEKASMLAFFREQPLTLQRDDLCVVHAQWDAQAIQQLCKFANVQGAIEAPPDATFKAPAHLFQPTRPAWDGESAEAEAAAQNSNPLSVLTSGAETVGDHDRMKFAGGRWRQVVRQPWWEAWDDDRAVVFGHYWRHPTAGDFAGVAIDDGVGPSRNAYCVDFSVGRRPSHQPGALAALRWTGTNAPPTVVFDEADPFRA
ncbi:MAG: Bis(5-nucleosyl)-tetraphosphatase prpE [Pseudomonadota bacterium]|jgi:hypothetical protein